MSKQFKECCYQLCITKDLRPFIKVGVGCDDDAGTIIKLVEQVKEQRTTRRAERPIAELRRVMGQTSCESLNKAGMQLAFDTIQSSQQYTPGATFLARLLRGTDLAVFEQLTRTIRALVLWTCRQKPCKQRSRNKLGQAKYFAEP